jgi:hypothetical protein
VALRLTLCGLVIGFTIGCVPNPTLYQWGEYEQKLHEAYKDPSAIPEFQAELLELIQASELNGVSPPPGVYAEYGYALYLRGQLSGAIVYFAKEREAWPESAVLMTTVIQRIQERAKKEGTLDAESDGAEGASTEDEAIGARGSAQ